MFPFRLGPPAIATMSSTVSVGSTGNNPGLRTSPSTAMLNCGVTVTNGSLKIRCNPAPISSRICVKVLSRVSISPRTDMERGRFRPP